MGDTGKVAQVRIQSKAAAHIPRKNSGIPGMKEALDAEAFPHSRLDAENGLPYVIDALIGGAAFFGSGPVFRGGNRHVAAKAIQPPVLNYGPCLGGHQGAPGFALFDPLPEHCR